MTALWLPELPHTPFAILTVVFQKPADWSDKEPAEGIKYLGSEIPEKKIKSHNIISNNSISPLNHSKCCPIEHRNKMIKTLIQNLMQLNTDNNF